MIKLLVIALIVSMNATAQNGGLQYTDNSVIRFADLGNVVKNWRKPGTDSIFSIKVFSVGDTAKEFRYTVSDVYTTIAKVNGLQAALDAKSTTDHTHAYGTITGSPTTTAFLSNSTNKNFVTDAQTTVIGNTSGTNTGDNATNTQYSGLVSNANHTGDATGSTALTLATVNSNVGSFTSANITVNAKGLITAAANGSGGSGLDDNTEIKSYQSVGSPLLAQTIGSPIQLANTSSNLTDGQIRWIQVPLAKAATINGIYVYVRVLGSYTGDNNNRVGLYTYSGGTLTQVAASTNSATLWTSAANAFQSINFSSTYAASAATYYVALLYNNSAQTTAPAIASGTALNNAAMATIGFTNSAKMYGTSNGADLPASIAMSAITASTVTTWVGLR